MSERDFDVVVFGATGFTGRLVARYLAERDPEPGLRWAIAGRNRDKLATVAAELGDPPQIVADSHDRASLDALCAKTTVVCTTVGPYAKHGAELVAACVAAGTHYVDLTGEPQFIRRMIDAHHTDATSRGVRIVHCCGFDSIPSDLGVFNLQRAAIERDGAPVTRVETLVTKLRGGFSGGTVASLVNVLIEASDPATRKILGNPYGLVPGRRGPDGSEQRGSRYSEAGGGWTGPFVMASINERVVRRTNALLDDLYGADFRYGESMFLGDGFRGRVRATQLAAGYGAGLLAMAIPFTRGLVLRRLPDPGEGPTEEQIEKGSFTFRLIGHGGSEPIELEVRGKRDPGYGATACMLSEAAICLARNPDLPRAGVLTPASAMGDPLTARLNATDVTFHVTV